MLKLVKPDKKYKRQYIEMLEEWQLTGGKIIPYSITKPYEDFDNLIVEFEKEEKGILDPRFVPATTLWAYDEERDKIIGAVNIRHRLNEMLLMSGGHVGDGVRPSERRKGFATQMIHLALQECREMGIHKVLMVCFKNNIGSAKSIMNNGGILENEVVYEDGRIDQRYWIEI